MSSIATSYSATDWFAYNAGSGNNWTLNSTDGVNSSKCARYGYDYYDAADCYLVSAPFTVSATMDELGVSLYEKTGGYTEKFEAFFVKASEVTDNASVVTATHHAAIATASYTNGDYAEVTGSNGDYALAGQSVRLVVHCTSAANMYYLCIDDITVTETLATGCPKPKNLEATNITAESATLSWTTSEAPSNGFNVRYRTAEIENPFFFDDFETNDLTGWTIYTDGEAPQSNGWYTINPQNGLSFDAYSGSYCASAWSWSNVEYDADNWLISPQVPLTGTLRFYVRTNPLYPDEYEVLLSSTGTDESDFDVTLQAMAAAPTTGEWEEVSIDLSSYSGNGYIAIHHVTNNMNYLLIDDFGIYDDPTPAGAWTNTTSNTNSKDIASLTENTVYDFEVQSNCGGELSDWVASTFTTNPSCMPVANLAVSDATTTTISLTWTDQNSGSASYIITDGDDNAVTVTNLTITGCTVTGLTANTAYTFKVSADCGSTAETIQARTDCNAITTLPYNESFEGDTYYCWDLDGFNLLHNNTYAHTGDYSIFAQNITNPVYAILPATTTNISDLILNFWWYNVYSGYDFGSLEVGYLTDIADYTTFVTVGTIDMSTSTGAYAQTDDYGFNGAPAGARIALKYTKGAGGSCIIIDDVIVDEAPDCMKPTDLDANPSATEAELSWTANSGETAWTIYYKKTSETTYATKAATTNPYILSPLEANTNYDYYVVANCSGSETSDPSSVYSFKTECGAVTITATEKYTENFESPVVTSTYSSTTGLELPSCWENPYTTGYSAAGQPHLIAAGSSYNYSTNQVLNFYGSGTNYVTLPEFANDLKDLQISFKWATESNLNGTLTLGYITDGDVNYNTFTEISGASYPASSSSYHTLIQADPVELSAVPATATRLAFRWDYTGQYSCNVDDIVVELIPTCKVPTGLACTDYTATTATFDWTGNGDNQTAWQLYISDKNIAPADNIAASEVINVTTKPYTVPGLTAEKTYYAWVRGNCTASSEGYSEWSEGVEFMPSAYKDFTYQDGATSSTSTLPIYGSYVSNATNKGQMLIPASAFPVNMTDATVRRLTFYTTSSYTNVSWGDAEFDVLVTEVDATSFETAAFFDWDDMTTVFSGKLSVSDQQMVINLDAPFTYNGGNLLIGFNLTTAGTTSYVSWVATYGSTYLGAYQYGTNSVSRTQYQPKTTFNYLPNATPRPINPHATEELSTEATLAWTAPNSTEVVGYQYQYKVATATEWPTALTDGTGLTANITGLTPETTYDFRVRAVYPGPAYSQYAETQFTTTAACAIPNGLAAANLTMNTADLTWNASTEVSDYTVEYRTAAHYEFLETDFEDGFIPSGWTSEGASSWTVSNGYDGSTAAHSGSKNAKITHTTRDNVTYLVTPKIDLSSASGLNIHCWFMNKAWGSDIDGFGVYYRINGGAWNEIFSTEEAHSTWTEVNEALPVGAYAANCQFGFKMTDDYGYGVGLDDITLGDLIPAGSWNEATDEAPNTGVYTITGLTSGTKYDVRVYANCTTDPDGESTTTTFSTLADGTKVFNNAAGDNMWSTAGNWVPAGAPSITNNAVIRANVTIDNGTVATAKKITFEGSTTPTLTIADGGQLQTDNTVTATVKKSITGYTGSKDHYYLIGNPLSSYISVNNPDNTYNIRKGTYDLYSWSRTSELEWSYYGAENNNTLYMGPGTGYLYANAADVELTFTGTVFANNIPLNSSVYYTEPTAGTTDFSDWNLLANPFVCDAYLVDASENGNALPYYKMNDAGDGFTAVSNGAAVAPMQGIFYKATAAGTVYCTRTAPGAKGGQLNMNLRSGNKQLDNAIVAFGSEQKLEKFSFRANSSKIYMPVEGKDYAITNAEAQGEMPVSFKAEKNGSYTLSFSNENVEFGYLHLIDNMTGEDVNLLETPSYSFEAKTTDYASRFKLVFSTGNGVNDESFAFISDGNIILNGEGMLQVVDVMGRIMMQEENATSVSTSGMTPGVYVLRLINGDSVKTQKIVIK